MTDDMEQRLLRVTPRGVAPNHRARVLDAVAAELHGDAEGAKIGRPPEAEVRVHCSVQFVPRLALAVAALVVGAIGLNVWVGRAMDRRLAAVWGPPPVRKLAAELAADVAEVTDERTAQWVYRRLTEARPTILVGREYAAQLEQVIRQLTFDLEESGHEENQKSSHLDEHRRRRGDRNFARAQCLVCLEHWSTA